MQLCVFEDKRASNFLPLTYSRPVYELICGYTSLKNKIFRLFPSAKHSLHCRAYLEKVTALNNPGILVNTIEGDECIFVNGRVAAGDGLIKIFPKKKKENVSDSDRPAGLVAVAGEKSKDQEIKKEIKPVSKDKAVKKTKKDKKTEEAKAETKTGT